MELKIVFRQCLGYLVCPLCRREVECTNWPTQLYWPSNSSTYQVKERTIILYQQCQEEPDVIKLFHQTNIAKWKVTHVVSFLK
jgi:hypothetical protein